MLEDLKKQLSNFIAQRDQMQVQFHQLCGAIFACESLIKQFEEKNKEENSGGKVDSESN